MILKNKLLITVISCNFDDCLYRKSQSIKTWIPLIDKTRYHIIFASGNNNIKSSFVLNEKQHHSDLILKTDDTFDGLCKKIKILFNHLYDKTNCPYYWFLDHDTYVNHRQFNIFNDYSADWYGCGPWSSGNNNFIIGCGYYISRSFLKEVADKLEDDGHYYDIAMGEIFSKTKLKAKYSNNIHHNENGLEYKKINNLLFGHKVDDMEKMHSLYINI